MTIPIVIVIGAVVSVFFGILGNFISVEITDNNKPFKVEITSHLPSTERLQQLVGILNSTAQEADKLIQEISQDLKQRQESLAQLQVRNTSLSAEEEAIKKRLEILRETKVEVAEYFQKQNEESLERIERRGVRRDLFIFIVGVVVTAIVTVVVSVALKHFGLV